MNLKSNFARSLIGVGGGALVLTLGQAIVVLIATRFLAPDKLGVYFILVASAGIISSIASCGTNIGLVKYTVDSNEKEKIPLILTSFLFYIISLLFVTTISLAVNYSYQYIYIHYEYIIFTASFSFFFYLNYVLQALKKFKSVAVANASNGLFKVVITLVVVAYIDLGWNGFIWSIIASNVIAIFLQLISVARDIPSVDVLRFEIRKLKSMLRFSFPIYLNQVYSNLYDRGYTLLIAFLLDPVSVSLYGVATMIPSFVIQMRQVFNGVYFPKICELVKSNIHKAKILLSYSVTLMFILISAGAIIFYVLDKYVVALLFTEKYMEVCLAIFILLCRSAFAFGSSIMGFTLVSLNKNSAPFKINVFITTLSFGISYFVIPDYGYMGAVYVALFSSILSFIINSVCLKIYGLELKLAPSVMAAGFLVIAINLLYILQYEVLAVIAMIVFMVVAVYSVRKIKIIDQLKGRSSHV